MERFGRRLVSCWDDIMTEADDKRDSVASGSGANRGRRSAGERGGGEGNRLIAIGDLVLFVFPDYAAQAS